MQKQSFIYSYQFSWTLQHLFLSSITWRPKVNKTVEALGNAINKLDLVTHLKHLTAEHTFFPIAHEAFINTDYILGH